MIGVIDGHCDVLSKLLQKPHLDFRNDLELDVTLSRLQQAGTTMQAFAIYLSENLEFPSFTHVLRCAELFYTRILCHPEMVAVKTKQDLRFVKDHRRIGALLTLEGVDALQGNLTYVRNLFDLGVRSIGLTWNYANWAADGVREPRQGGLTIKGRKLIKLCDEMGILLDVSHLTEAGFWELLQEAKRPFIASHSNAFKICPNLRNLKDDQIEAIIQNGGRIGLAFVPYFIDTSETVAMTQLLLHIDHICSLGGARHIGFGSDFDGISTYVTGLHHPGDYPAWIELLHKYYKEDEVRGFIGENWYRFYEKNLPE